MTSEDPPPGLRPTKETAVRILLVTKKSHVTVVAGEPAALRRRSRGREQVLNNQGLQAVTNHTFGLTARFLSFF